MFQNLLDEQTKYFNARRDYETEEDDTKYVVLKAFADILNENVQNILKEYQDLCELYKQAKKELKALSE